MTKAAHDVVFDHIRSEAISQLTQDLVRAPSHIDNPGKEGKVSSIVEESLRAMGCEVAQQEIAPNRRNVIGVLKGTGSGRNLLLNGHLDTVPPGTMTDPFSAVIRDGRVWGRGTADMKGAIASMLVAMAAVAESPLQLVGNVIFAGTVAEETGAAGMCALMDSNRVHADGCVVGEPTSLNIGVAHKGIEWLELSATGVAAHASLPSTGRNAISHMAELVVALHRRLLPTLEKRTHDLLGPSTMNIGTIDGGLRPNIVPERCTVTLDRRWLPGESVESIRQEVDEIIAEVRRAIPELDVTIRRLPEISHVWHGPYEADEESEILEVAREAITTWGSAPPRLIGLPYWTDGALVQRTGIPTVILGPGDPAACHTADESVSVNALLQAARAYCEIILRFCQGGGH